MGLLGCKLAVSLCQKPATIQAPQIRSFGRDHCFEWLRNTGTDTIPGRTADARAQRSNSGFWSIVKQVPIILTGTACQFVHLP